MPLLLRTVEPPHVSRGTLPDRFPVPNDLEAVANGTLSNVIRQLSSLSHHAEELFLDLIKVGSEIATRASNLQARIDRLAVRVSVIDSVQDESSMQESLHTKPFSSSLNFNQQVVSRQSLPPAMEKKFNLCDKPPPLDKLNVYRDDGKDGLKFYTDPSYFFDLWRQEMLKDTERVIDKNKKPHKLKNDGQSRHKKRVRPPHNTRERQRHIAMEQGEVIMQTPNQKMSNSPIDLRDSSMSSSGGGVRRSGGPEQQQYMRTPTAEYDGGVNNHQIDYNRSYPTPASMGIGSPMDPQFSPSSSPYEIHQRSYFSEHGGSIGSGSPGGGSYKNGKNMQQMNGGYGYRPTQPPPAPPPGPHELAGCMQNNGLQNNGVASNSSAAAAANMRAMQNMRNSPRDMLKVSRTTLPPPPPLPTDDDAVQDPNTMFPPPLDEDNYEHGGPPGGVGGMGTMMHGVGVDDLPLPPPPDIPGEEVFSNHLGAAAAAVPPPPPPPPVNQQQQLPPMGQQQMHSHAQAQAVYNGSGGGGELIKPKPSMMMRPPVVRDGRSELLKAIRDGIELRKVETRNDVRSDEKPSSYHDVASILARRVAVEMSDSESGSSDYDSDGWDETSA